MGLPKRKEVSPYDQVIKLVEQLPSEEQEQLRQQLNSKSWAQRWDALVERVRAYNKNLPPISDEEIADEFMAYRDEQKANNAQSSH